MDVTLAGCWAKFERAKRVVDDLRTDIQRADPDYKSLPLYREFDSVDRAVVCRIERVMQIGEDWPLLVGDAIYNMRCALDHLMWQLAVIYLQREPTEGEAKDIQFPVVRREIEFRDNRFLQFVRPTDMDLLKPFQPYEPIKPSELHPLPALVWLSNRDKHRRLHLLVVVSHQLTYTNRPTRFVDCVPDSRVMESGATVGVNITYRGGAPRPKDEVLRRYVQPVGPSPDVELDTSLACYVAVNETWNVLDTLTAIGEYVATVLRAFEPIIEAARSV